MSSVNFCKALLLGGLAGIMSIPWIMIASPRVGVDPWIRLPASFLVMILLAGAGMAWGKKGGMHGVFPGKRRMLMGLCIGICLAFPIILLSIFYFDPIYMENLREVGGEDMVRTYYPGSGKEILAIILWVMSFEVMLFQVGTMSFAARVFGSRWVSVVLAVLFSVYIEHSHVLMLGLGGGISIVAACSSFIAGLLGCLLFVQFGLPGTAVFMGLLSARLFFL